MDDLAPKPKPTPKRRKKTRLPPKFITDSPSPNEAELEALLEQHEHEPLKLIRSKEGRSLSESRFEGAQSFFPSRRAVEIVGITDTFYKAGITAQLALSSHLLDVGFPDRWCAVHIGHRVAVSLSYANATGLNHTCPDMGRLAMVLNPYWKWNARSVFDRGVPYDGGFTVEEVGVLLLALLRQVGEVTGHEWSQKFLNDPDRLGAQIAQTKAR